MSNLADYRSKLTKIRNARGADMMYIVTANGLTILFDRTDEPLVSQYTWCANIKPNGRIYATAHVPGSGDVNKRRVVMHRLLMQPGPGLLVHHKNNDGLDNRRCNLQITTNRVNIACAKIGSGGVTFFKARNKWRARATDETGRRVSLRLHETKEAAKAAVQKWRFQRIAELEAKGTLEAVHIAALFRENAA